jgi:hypothetical protein
MGVILVISFRVRRRETEAYVNNSAKFRKGLYIIDHKIRGRGLRIRNVITQAEPKKKNSDERRAMYHRWYSSSVC